MPFSRRLLEPEWKVPSRTSGPSRAPARAEPTSAELVEATVLVPAAAVLRALSAPPPEVPNHVAVRVVGRSTAEAKPTPLVGVSVEVLLGERVAARNRTDPSGATWLPQSKEFIKGGMIVVRGDDGQIVARHEYASKPLLLEVGESPSVAPAYARGRETLARVEGAVVRAKEIAVKLAKAEPTGGSKEPKESESAARPSKQPSKPATSKPSSGVTAPSTIRAERKDQTPK